VRRSAVLIALVAAAGASGCGERDARPDADGRPAEPTPGELPPGRGHVLARVREQILVHDRPGGRPVARLRPRTPFDGPRTLGVVAVRDERRWLAIHSPVLANDELGWIANDPTALDLARTRVALHVSLARAEIELRRGKRRVRTIPISIGRAGTSTPAGRFQVTDKLPASRFPKGPYGCCILALSARQPNLPRGWAGGDRIAIHGTPRPETIGSASSNGCLRASDRDLRILMRDVPVGAPVFIRP
jgi:hypothetical protein